VKCVRTLQGETQAPSQLVKRLSSLGVKSESSEVVTLTGTSVMIGADCLVGSTSTTDQGQIVLALDSLGPEATSSTQP
jgi:hypothetical protein